MSPALSISWESNGASDRGPRVATAFYQSAAQPPTQSTDDSRQSDNQGEQQYDDDSLDRPKLQRAAEPGHVNREVTDHPQRRHSATAPARVPTGVPASPRRLARQPASIPHHNTMPSVSSSPVSALLSAVNGSARNPPRSA